MTVVRVDPDHPDPAVLARAAQILREGRLVAFPTETVYGLGANALDESAVRRIFEVKGRPEFNPLIVHVPDVAAARDLVEDWTPRAEALASAFWPGPLTLVLRKREIVPPLVTAGLPTVAVRMPGHPTALALLRASGLPLAAPSANRYTQVSPTTARHVERALGDGVELILDAGPTRVGIESTVVDLSGASPRLLRPGTLPRASLEAVAGPLLEPLPAQTADAPRAAPGMVGRHYAPRARVRLFAADERGAAATIAEETRRRGGRVGALLLEPWDAPLDSRILMPAAADAYANRLYAALHELDDRDCVLILIQRVPEDADWEGVRDRLARAASAE